jgi:transposase InsO family protein
MPWKEVSAVELREEFVMLAGSECGNVRELCRRYGISPTTGYKWLSRYAAAGRDGLANNSRRPHRSPGRTPASVEGQILALRDRHAAWGARKLQRRLRDLGLAAVPSLSTITEILRRHGRLDAKQASKHRAFLRFEHATPNDLWQMDFKGHFPLRSGRCHPLTVLDDHSRFALGLEACADERAATVQSRLVSIFRRYGLPWRILVDNGPPWGDDAFTHYTRFTVWLLRLDIAVSHGRPYHPQIQGKAERFHRSLNAELIAGLPPTDIAQCQRRFDAWRHVYNCERPHEGISLDVPMARYHPSPRPFPETLPPIDYNAADIIRRVSSNGQICFNTRLFRVSKAFAGQQVAIRPTTHDGRYDVCFGRHPVAAIDLTGAT